jgi:hypothetical protein
MESKVTAGYNARKFLIQFFFTVRVTAEHAGEMKG